MGLTDVLSRSPHGPPPPDLPQEEQSYVTAQVNKFNDMKSELLSEQLLACSSKQRRRIDREKKSNTAVELQFATYSHNCFELPTVALRLVKSAFDQSVRNAKAKQQKKSTTCQNGHLLNCATTEFLSNLETKFERMSDSEADSQVMAKRSEIKNQIELVIARLSYLQHQAEWSWCNGTCVTTKPTTLQKDEIGQQINKLQSLYSQ